MLVHEQLTEAIFGEATEVHKAPGPGLLDGLINFNLRVLKQGIVRRVL
jgi:hypothetical protein